VKISTAKGCPEVKNENTPAMAEFERITPAATYTRNHLIGHGGRSLGSGFATNTIYGERSPVLFQLRLWLPKKLVLELILPITANTFLFYDFTCAP
jgi:hypothetical protein